MDGEKRGGLRPERKDFWNLRDFGLPFPMGNPEEEFILNRLESANRRESTRWLRFFKQLMEFSDYERKIEMVCPTCKNPTPEVCEIRAAVDRISACDHCLNRLISFLNGKKPYLS